MENKSIIISEIGINNKLLKILNHEKFNISNIERIDCFWIKYRYLKEKYNNGCKIVKQKP